MAQAFETEGRRRRGIGNGRDQFKQRTDDVLTDVTELRRDLSKLAAAFGKLAQSQVYDASDKIQHLSHDVRERAQHGADYAAERVRAKPLSALGVSLGVGVALGLALANLGKR